MHHRISRGAPHVDLMTGPTRKFQHVTAGKTTTSTGNPPHRKGSTSYVMPSLPGNGIMPAASLNNSTNYLPLRKKCMETRQTTVPEKSTNEPNLRKMSEDSDLPRYRADLIPVDIVNICTSCQCLPASRHRKGLD